MTNLGIPEYRVTVDQLRPGVFIRLERGNWFNHPFLFNSFKIKDRSQIEVLRQLGVIEVTCVPSKSDRMPGAEFEQDLSVESAPVDKNNVDKLWRLKKIRAERLSEKRKRITQCEERYIRSARKAEEILKAAVRGSQEAVDDAGELIRGIAHNFFEDSESSLHLMNVILPDESIYSHPMNVTVLSMMLGRATGITEQDMITLGLGAMFHDLGHYQLEKKLLRRRFSLSGPELELFRKHPETGAELLSNLTSFPAEALEIVLRHHEQMDGNGYPLGLGGDDIGKLTSIVAVANVYDNHCNHPDVAQSLTPYLALSYMFSKQNKVLNEELLSGFVRCLGVYPPGTVVQLNNGAVGMVMSVNPDNQLNPSLVVYDPDIPKREALIVNLDEEPDLKVEKSIRLSHLPPEISEYLNPRTRISYYVER